MGKQAEDRALPLHEGVRNPNEKKWTVQKEGEKLLYGHLKCIQENSIFDCYLEYL